MARGQVENCVFYNAAEEKCDALMAVFCETEDKECKFFKEIEREETTVQEVKREGATLKIMLDDGAIMPTRAHDTDAGLDLYARETQIIPAKENAVFDTGVHIELPAGTVGMVKSKSGLNVKHGLTCTGVIDAGYTGSIVVNLFNHSGYDYKVNAGDKISQLVIMPIFTPPLEVVESLTETERGAGGFGSTGK